MTNESLNSHADRILSYLRAASPVPVDGLAILGVALLKIYQLAKDPSSDMTIEAFANDLRDSIIGSYRESLTGTERLQ